MRFISALTALVMCGALALTACANQADNTKPDSNDAAQEFPAGSTQEKLSKANAITIGTKFDQPLFGLRGPSGQPEGFDVEIGMLIADALGIAPENIEWKEAVSANREPFIEQGEVDIVVATYTINPERKKVISFGGPYYTAGQDLLVLSGNPEAITGIDDVKGKAVCSVTGSTSEHNLREAGVEVIATDTYSNCLEPLRQGKVVAVSTDNVILAGLADQNPGEFSVIDQPFTEEPYGIGLKKDDTQFRSFINETLKEAFADGSWEKAWEKSAGKILDTPKPPAIAD